MTRNFSALFPTQSLLFSILVVCALLLSGCGAARYRADYNGFNAAYADSSNRQMLLNLARLDQHDPTYFLQFGQISVQYQVTSSANLVVNETIPANASPYQFKSPLATGTGTVGVGASTTPSFTFIPVSDDKVAQELLLPVPPDVLYTLFQQGAPVDQLLRLMVERFEIELPDDNGKITTYANTPGRCSTFSYTTFLKICAIAREFQIDGHLKLQANEDFVQLADGWTSSDAPVAKDILDAQKQGYIYKQVGDKWELGQMELRPSFILDGNAGQTYQRLQKEAIYGNGIALKNIYALLSSGGFSVQGELVQDQPAGSHLVLRSFLNILAAAAQEQTNFTVAVSHTTLAATIPDSERRPILRLKWDGYKDRLLNPLQSVDYQGQTYMVTDPDTGAVDENSSWNRDVFRLLAELATQVSIDISKFPLPTTLQVVQ